MQSSNPTSKRGRQAPLKLTILVLVVVGWDVAIAYPDGAPWGAASLDNAEHCSSCHFESEPVRQSAAITLAGFGDRDAVAPNTRHVLEIRLLDPGATTAGFQLLASSGSGDAGRFETAAEDVEVIGHAARSIATRIADNNKIAWSLTWHSPSLVDYPVTLTIAISAANDDGSPFGDRIHYRVFTLQAPGPLSGNNDAD